MCIKANWIWKPSSVDLMVEDHVVDTNGNGELETSSSTPAVTFRRKRIKLKTPAETKTQDLDQLNLLRQPGPRTRI